MITKRETVIIFLGLLLGVSIYLVDNANAQVREPNCERVPEYIRWPIEEAMNWTHKGLKEEPESLREMSEWLAKSPESKHSGKYAGAILLHIIYLADSIDHSEWAAIGIDTKVTNE